MAREKVLVRRTGRPNARGWDPACVGPVWVRPLVDELGARDQRVLICERQRPVALEGTHTQRKRERERERERERKREQG